MSDRKPVRKRAVKLTPEGLELLRAGLTRVWESDPQRTKLTREARADIFGVSLATADRIVKQEGVDRPTLSLVFKRLGLTWDDRLCEPLSRSEIECQESTSEPPAPAAEPPSAPAEPRTRKPWRRRAILAMGAVGAALAVAFSQAPARLDEEATRHHAFNVNLRSAEIAYHRADYDVAKHYLAKVFVLVEQNPKAPQLSLALRLAGDMATTEGRYAEALEYYKDALVIRRRTNQHRYTIPPLLEAIGDTELKLGNFEGARGYFEECLNGYREHGEPGGVAMALRGLGSAEAGLGNTALAKERFNEGLQVIRGRNDAGMEADIRARMALVFRDEGDLDEAKRLLTACLDYWQAEGHKRWIAKTRFELGTVELLAGRANVALMLLAQSRTEYSAMGDAGGAEACKTWLDRLFAQAETGKGVLELAEHSDPLHHVATGPDPAPR
jgi:tetratricopeptide (TPR) repeat protein